jgi:hypothetical protein
MEKLFGRLFLPGIIETGDRFPSGDEFVKVR